MAFDSEQVGILRGSALAVAFALAAVGAGYAWLPARWFGLTKAMTTADQLAFTLKAELLLFVWLAWCVRWRSQPPLPLPPTCLQAGLMIAGR